jgi:CBS domain-containing protein
MARLRSIMTGDVVTLNAQATLREAIGILRAENVSGAPVVQGGEVVGVVSVSDILDFEVDTAPVPTDTPSFYSEAWDDAGVEVAEWFTSERGREWDLLGEHVVAEVMTRGVFALPPDTWIDEAAAYMMRRGIHRILVMEGKRLLGIASASDFVRAVAEHRA